jgi:peptide/nickel transport system permease protein
MSKIKLALTLLTLLVLPILLSPWLAPDSTVIDLAHRLGPPQPDHWLGTDELGRDVLSRLLAGGRISLAVAIATAVLAGIIGTIIGLLAGWLGGFWDATLMRLTDGVNSVPVLPLLIVLAAADPVHMGLPPAFAASEAFATTRLIVIIAMVGWTAIARLVRAQTLSLKARDHVRAAVALGVTPTTLVLRHVLPHLTSPILVATTASMSGIILTESALSFLGLGVRPPVASWGNMLSGAMDLVWSAPLLALWPGIAIFMTVLGISLLGDGFNDK